MKVSCMFSICIRRRQRMALNLSLRHRQWRTQAPTSAMPYEHTTTSMYLRDLVATIARLFWNYNCERFQSRPKLRSDLFLSMNAERRMCCDSSVNLKIALRTLIASACLQSRIVPAPDILCDWPRRWEVASGYVSWCAEACV